MNETYKNCIVNTGNAHDITLNINGNNSNSDFNFEEFSKLLDDMLKKCEDQNERLCALEAQRYADKKDESNLKQYLKDNFPTFSNGTFATLAGGLLLEMVKRLVGY